MLVHRKIIFSIMIAGSFAFFSFSTWQKNTAPVVSISAPDDAAKFSVTDVIPYRVSVSDHEDGESKFDEIPATEIFVEVRYFREAAKAAAFKKLPSKKDDEGFAIIRKQDCFTCHTVWNKLIGPSFNEISMKYQLKDTSDLAAHVIGGSTGRWGSAAMPTHPTLSAQEARKVVKWILKNSKDPNVDYVRGAEGSIQARAQQKFAPGAAIVIKASYSDHGVNDDPASVLTGYDKKMIFLR